jgi:transposase
MIAAHREPDCARARDQMRQPIEAVSHGVPAALTEIITIGRTLKKRATDVLAYVDRPGTSNGPTEAINGRLEHLRGSALGFRNLTNTSGGYASRNCIQVPSGGLSHCRASLRPRRRACPGARL